MSDTIPSGYTDMLAGAIRAATAKALKDRHDTMEVWRATLIPALVAWRSQPGWWFQLNLWCARVPKDPQALRKWYLGHQPWDMPDVPGIEGAPRWSSRMSDWDRRVQNLPDDQVILVDIDDAAVITTWIKS